MLETSSCWRLPDRLLALGVIYGIVFDNLALGISLGICFGISFSMIWGTSAHSYVEHGMADMAGSKEEDRMTDIAGSEKNIDE